MSNFKIPTSAELDQFEKDIEDMKKEIAADIDELIADAKKDDQFQAMSPEDRGRAAKFFEDFANVMQQELIRAASFLRHGG